MYQLGFLGLGKMGSSILFGVLKEKLYQKEGILFYAPSKETQNRFLSLGINLAQNENEVFKNSDIIVLAIKPQKYDEIFAKLEKIDFSNKIIISLAPGKSIDYLSSIFKGARISRVMPNTPAIIAKAVTTTAFKDEPIEEVINIFKSIGKVQILKEKQIDEAIPLQGSMPAYLFEFVKSFISVAIEYEIDKEVAKRLAFETVISSCMLALESEEDIDTLINNVCSKGGSTIAGLNELRDNGFNEAIKKCYKSCVNRSNELGKNNG